MWFALGGEKLPSKKRQSKVCFSNPLFTHVDYPSEIHCMSNFGIALSFTCIIKVPHSGFLSFPLTYQINVCFPFRRSV